MTNKFVPLSPATAAGAFRTLRRIFLLFGITASLCLVSFGQVYSGSLTGVVRDPSGAVVPNAKALLTDQDKGFTYATVTDTEGRYVLRNLPPGRYSLKVTATGMRPYSPPPLTLTVGQNAEANVDFEIQGAAEKVDVEATATLLQTQDASTGQLVNQKFINDLPLTSRSVFNLAQLSPGVTQAAGGSFGLNAGATNFISNGGRNSTADIVLDGVSQTNNENNSGVTTALYTPSVDAVQEFNVQQNTYTAEVGFGGNTVINVVTKSGTNQFHGSLFEFLQNSALNANNFFNNQNGVKISPKKNNQFGGTIGGPIRKDKLFFFFDYQGTISRSTGTARAGVASAAERQGDFGELCGRNGGSFDSAGRCSAANGQLWDPMSSTYSSSAGGAVRSAYIPFNNMATYMSPGAPGGQGAGNSALATTWYCVSPTETTPPWSVSLNVVVAHNNMANWPKASNEVSHAGQDRTSIWNDVQVYESFCLTPFVITVTELGIVLSRSGSAGGWHEAIPSHIADECGPKKTCSFDVRRSE